MSDSRSILLKLSVRDADVVRRELVAMGAQGEAALARLDAAATRAAGTGGGGAAGGGGMRGLNNVMQQGGFQLQDFAVQVQGGTSALTALSQQGSQFLGIFGTGGAIAGAVLTVGILAAKFIDLGGATERAEAAEKAYADALNRTNGFLLTAQQRTQALANERRVEALGAGETEIEALRAQARDFAARRQSLTGEAEPGDAGAFSLSQMTQETRRELARVEAQESVLAGRIASLEERQRLIAEGASGDERDRAEQLRRELDERYRIMREHEERVAELRRLRSRGLFAGEGELSAAEAASAARRDEAIAAMARRGARSERGAGETADEIIDRVRGQTVAEGQAAWDRYAQSVNLASAGLSGAAGVLAQYERDQNTLRQTLELGIITEAEFGAEVERTSLRLGEQIDEIRRRADGTGDISRQLGLTFTSAFEDAIAKGKSFREVLSGIAADLAKLIIRRSITEPLFRAASPLLDGIGSGIASFFGLGGASVPGRAIGGPVTAGNPYIVGERGPELFLPNNSGTIVPNHALGGGVTIQQSLTINAQGAGPREIDILRAQIPAMVRGVSLAAVEDAMRRGGGFTRSVRGYA